jgi:two-component system LytT family response regulator
VSAPVRVVVVDDEELARERLRRLLEREPDVVVVAECANGKEAVREVLARRPDVLFLDVQMPGLDGFGVLRALRAEADAGGAGAGPLPLVVFVTAFDEHALRAFDVHAVDYVLKPIDPDRFRDAVARARARHAQADSARRLRELQRLLEHVEAPGSPREPEEAAEATLQRAAPRSADRLVVRSQERLFFVRTAEIDWIEAAGNYAKLHVGGRTHLIRETMSRLEEGLDPGRFARIHRSTIVNLDRVKELRPWFAGDYLVALHDGTELKLSRGYRAKLEEQMGSAG